MKPLYFDHHSAARPFPEVVETMLAFLGETWAPSSPHTPSHLLRGLIEEELRHLYRLIDGQHEDTFIFTSSGAEAVNHVVLSAYLDITRKTGKNYFVTSTLDEAPAILSMERLNSLGCVHHLAEAKEGKITPESICEALTPRTALVSLSWANGMTGVIQPVKAIGEICKERGVLFHVDATHILGRGEVSWETSGADIITFNGEQIHGPKGTGGIFIRKGVSISPLIIGGDEQGGMRGGSFNTAAFMGLAKAAQLAKQRCDTVCTHIAYLRSRFETLLQEAISEVKFFFTEEERVPTILVAHFPKVTTDALAYLLNKKNLFANLGGGHFQQIEHLMKSAGIPTLSALSFSLSYDTKEEEIHEAAERIAEAYTSLRALSKHLEIS